LLAVGVLGAVAVAGCSSGSSSKKTMGSGSSATKPNVVFVLTDDLSMNLVQYMPHVRQMQKEGVEFTDYTVTDSLCCPSRSSIFTGRFPHNTGIFTNSSPDGGFEAFYSRGEEKQTYATAMQSKGYRTAMLGKYLNGYEPDPKRRSPAPQGYVPPGWNEWDVAGNGYPEFDYDLNQNATIVHYGNKPSDYLTDVTSRRGRSFIEQSVKDNYPFAIELATFAPHGPYTPAPQDAQSFPGLEAPRGPAFDRPPANAPTWLAGRAPLTQEETARIDEAFRKRVQSVQAVDRMLGAIEDTLDRAGVADKTVIVFSSDNGYHMGEYRLMPGKMTAFETDLRVPLVVTGPRMPAGQRVTRPVSNVDLAPTFEELAGASIPPDVDGRSLVGLLHGQDDPGWRTASLVEHHGPNSERTDPDKASLRSGNPTTYEAIRTTTFTYVEYADGGLEYYDRASDPDEIRNIVSSLPPARLDRLHDAVAALASCRGGTACWDAAHPSG